MDSELTTLWDLKRNFSRSTVALGSQFISDQNGGGGGRAIWDIVAVQIIPPLSPVMATAALIETTLETHMDSGWFHDDELRVIIDYTINELTMWKRWNFVTFWSESGGFIHNYLAPVSTQNSFLIVQNGCCYSILRQGNYPWRGRGRPVSTIKGI